MTRTQAYKILGIPPDAGKTEIKKRYHELLHQVHPDIERPSLALRNGLFVISYIYLTDVSSQVPALTYPLPVWSLSDCFR